LTTTHLVRIPPGDNRMPRNTESPAARRGWGPTLDLSEGPRVNLQLALDGEGLSSFGPNPTASLAGTKEGEMVFERRSLQVLCIAGPYQRSGWA
jgi:hypothetical protein